MDEKKLTVPAYPAYIMTILRQRVGLDDYDYSLDEELNAYSPEKVFKEVCEWHGFLGWNNNILTWVQDIFGIQLN